MATPVPKGKGHRVSVRQNTAVTPDVTQARLDAVSSLPLPPTPTATADPTAVQVRFVGPDKHIYIQEDDLLPYLIEQAETVNIDYFLLAHQKLILTLDLFNGLMNAFQGSSDGEFRKRCLLLMVKWTTTHWQDLVPCDEAIIKRMKDIHISVYRKLTKTNFDQLCLQMIDKIVSTITSHQKKEPQAEGWALPADSMYFDEEDLGFEGDEKEPIFMKDPNHFAEQVTLFHEREWDEIFPNHISEYQPPKQGENRNNPIDRFINHFNQLSNWAQRIICTTVLLPKRRIVVEKLIAVCLGFLSLRNFNGLFAIFSGFRSAPCHRLRQTFHEISDNSAFVKLSTIVDYEGNYKQYRKWLNKNSFNEFGGCPWTDQDEPLLDVMMLKRPSQDEVQIISAPGTMTAGTDTNGKSLTIPHLAVLLADIVHLNDAVKSKDSEGLINLSKPMLVGKLINEVKKTKNSSYTKGIVLNEATQAYIRKQIFQPPELEFQVLHSYSTWLEPKKGSERPECPIGLQPFVLLHCPEELTAPPPKDKMSESAKLKRAHAEQEEEVSPYGKELYFVLQHHALIPRDSKKKDKLKKQPTKKSGSSKGDRGSITPPPLTQSGSDQVDSSPAEKKEEKKNVITEPKTRLEHIEIQNQLILNYLKELSQQNEFLISKINSQEQQIQKLTKQNEQFIEVIKHFIPQSAVSPRGAGGQQPVALFTSTKFSQISPD